MSTLMYESQILRPHCSAEDDEILSYLEEWQRTQPTAQDIISKGIGTLEVKSSQDVLAATRESYKDEVSELIEQELCHGETVNQEVDTILAEMAAQYQRPRLPHVCWNYVNGAELRHYYIERCVQLGEILTAEDIERDEYLPSWRFFSRRGYDSFDELLYLATWDMKSAGREAFLKLVQDYEDRLLAYRIMDERQSDIDTLVHHLRRDIAARAKAEQTHKIAVEEYKARIAAQDAAYQAAQAQARERQRQAQAVKTNHDTNGQQEQQRECQTQQSPPRPSLFENLRQAANELLEGFLGLFLA